MYALIVKTTFPVPSPRYQCDQCPYRCHRMDQLNSHKLRHQDKSLICEICAYACKRKYELRNHMLAKHSGEEKPPSAFKCKYCTYTTCYRQALQNHENCKHTKLKEFRCALCLYSSFSSISLFLHKRKAHGYVPGDKAWLENYAAKEKERNSTGFVEDFYNKRSAAHEQNEPPSTSRRERCAPPGAAGHSASTEAESGTTVEEVPHEVVDEGVSDSPPTVNSPEEYCTLILTTLSTTDYQTPALQNTEENCANPTAPHEKAAVSTSTNSSEKDNVAMPHEECDPRDLEDSYKPLNNSTSQSEEPRKCPTPEVEIDDETIGSILPPVHNQPSDFEVRLKAMKKHDQDQAEAMVLEGRVQMLVVPTKDAYRCDKCSFVTFEKNALKHHSRTLCHGKMKEHKCQACGAQFKQRRGLDSHLVKKCPMLPRKTRTFVGISKTCPAAEGSSTELPEGTNSDQTELLPQNISTDDQVHQQEEEGTTCEGFDDHETTSTDPKHQQSKTRINIVVKKTICGQKNITEEKVPLH